jgi:hypothetical protein
MYTMESKNVSRAQQLYKLFCQAYRQRNEEALNAFADFSFHFWNGLSKLPDLTLPLYRGLDKRLADINDLYHEGNVVHWHYPSSCTTQKAVASQFSNGGTLLSLINVTKAKSIQVFSLIPSEEEYMIDFTSSFDVMVSLSCDRAKALKQFSSDLPDNVDLVILNAKAPAFSHAAVSCAGLSSTATAVTFAPALAYVPNIVPSSICVTLEAAATQHVSAETRTFLSLTTSPVPSAPLVSCSDYSQPIESDFSARGRPILSFPTLFVPSAPSSSFINHAQPIESYSPGVISRQPPAPLSSSHQTPSNPSFRELSRPAPCLVPCDVLAVARFDGVHATNPLFSGNVAFHLPAAVSDFPAENRLQPALAPVDIRSSDAIDVEGAPVAGIGVLTNETGAFQQC